MKKLKQKQKGFTLIELLVVIAIIGLLASVVLLALSSARAKGRDARRISDLRQIATAANLQYETTGSYAEETAGGLQSMPTIPDMPIGGACDAEQVDYGYVGTDTTFDAATCIETSYDGTPVVDGDSGWLTVDESGAFTFDDDGGPSGP